MGSSGVKLAVLLLVALCRAAPPPSMEMVTLEVALGATAVLPCNGSSFLGPGPPGGGEEEEQEEQEEEEEEEVFVWEAMGRDVAGYRDGEVVEGPGYEGRVHLAAGALTGDWSLVLEGVGHGDVNMYECVLPGRRTLSTVWLRVEPPEAEALLVTAWLGDPTFLTCEAPEEEPAQGLVFWWQKNGAPMALGQQDEDRVHMQRDGNHVGLRISQVLISDRGVYRCFYQSGPSPEPRLGSPEVVRLVVLGSEHLDDGEEMDPEETRSPPTEPPAPHHEEEEEEEEEEGTPSDPTLLLSDDTLSDSILGVPETRQGDRTPWVLILIITVVLALTAVTLLILRARHVI